MGLTEATQPSDRKIRLVGYANFVRHNPLSDKFEVKKFHHIEFWCADATNAYKRFSWGLGMTLVAKSDQSTGNTVFASYVLQASDLVFTFTAPYSRKADAANSKAPLHGYDKNVAYEFLNTHGLAVRAVGVEVADAGEAYRVAVGHGAAAVQPPGVYRDEATGAEQTVAEVRLYGDVVMRFVSGSFTGPYLAGYAAVTDSARLDYGLRRLDHAVGNVPKLLDAVEYIVGFTGFHEFAEFTAEDVGTVDSGLNSMVLASNNEMVLLPVNEPTAGTPRKSQIQTYLEQNEGPGLQHLALKTDDVVATLREMRRRSEAGGFEFMPRPSAAYYRQLPAKVGEALTEQQYRDIEELGILADKDDQGVLLQIFTKPLGDRPTVFLEIIQRVGCMREVREATAAVATDASTSDLTTADAGAGADVGVQAPQAAGAQYEQAAGCGGFGKGNFSELFKSIENYERTLDV